MEIYIAIITLVIIVILVREAIIVLKRPQRMSELRHHISMITDPAGCDGEQVIRHYEACKHIIEHYGIGLEEVGNPKTGYIISHDGCIIADLADLYVEVRKSSQRAEAREYTAQLPLAFTFKT